MWLRIGVEYFSDTSVAGRPAREVTQDCDPMCQAAERHLRDSVLPFQVRSCH